MHVRALPKREFARSYPVAALPLDLRHTAPVCQMIDSALSLVAATNLDRLGRNLRECLNVVHDLREQGIEIKTLKDPIPIDTTDDSPMGELAVWLLALFAHLERVFMRERPAHAREIAQAKSKRPGQPRRLNVNQLAALDANQPVEQVAEAFGVSRATLYRYLAEHTS